MLFINKLESRQHIQRCKMIIWKANTLFFSWRKFCAHLAFNLKLFSSFLPSPIHKNTQTEENKWCWLEMCQKRKMTWCLNILIIIQVKLTATLNIKCYMCELLQVNTANKQTFCRKEEQVWIRLSCFMLFKQIKWNSNSVAEYQNICDCHYFSRWSFLFTPLKLFFRIMASV